MHERCNNECHAGGTEAAQVRCRFSPGMFAERDFRKRKLVDRTVPGAVLSDPAFGVDSKMYSDLQEMERKLDWTMLRKKAEIQDAMGRVAMVRSICSDPTCSY